MDPAGCRKGKQDLFGTRRAPFGHLEEPHGKAGVGKFWPSTTALPRSGGGRHGLM